MKIHSYPKFPKRALTGNSLFPAMQNRATMIELPPFRGVNIPERCMIIYIEKHSGGGTGGWIEIPKAEMTG